MDTNPLPAAPVASPFIAALPRISLLRYASATLALVVVLVGSVSYASESSLPDDALYAVKLHINENVVYSSRALFPPLRAEMQTELLARRLQEAEALVVEHAFNGDVADDLQKRITAHITDVRSRIAQAHERDHLEEAYEHSSALYHVLEAHSNILDILTENQPDTVEAVHELIGSLEVVEYETKQDYDLFEEETLVTQRTDPAAYLDTLRADYEHGHQKLVEALAELEGVEHHFIDVARSHVADAEAARAVARAYYEAERYTEAFEAFHEAIQHTKRAVIFIESYRALEKFTDAPARIVAVAHHQ